MHGMLGEILGMSVYMSSNAVSKQQVRFPRTKKKRIQKKWRKDNSNFDFKPAAYMVGGRLIAHPALMGNFKRYATLRL